MRAEARTSALRKKPITAVGMLERIKRGAAVARVALLAAGIGVWATGQATAHGGLSMDKDYCKLRIGPYLMHFTGYQPERDGGKEFCEDIPSTGATIIVLDFIDEALKELAVDVRIVRDGVGEADLDRATIFRLAPRLYPAGTLSFDYLFDEPGNYVGLVTVGGNGTAFTARFPFSVGTPFYLRRPLLIVIVAVALAGAYGFWRWRRTAGSLFASVAGRQKVL
jgi:hypothetical protein